MNKTAVVTGASSGIGEATARRLASEGFDVLIGARRTDRLEKIADQIGATWKRLDVTDPSSVAAFVDGIGPVNLLVNNAGGAKGFAALAEIPDDDWDWTYEANERSGDGHIINVGSIAGIETYERGAAYTAAKHAVTAITETLRLELLGKPIRVTEVQPGLVETEFSLVRFDGDAARAAKVYEGMTPLTADDVADCIVWAATRPSHVNIDTIVVKPRDQARATKVHRS